MTVVPMASGAFRSASPKQPTRPQWKSGGLRSGGACSESPAARQAMEDGLNRGHAAQVSAAQRKPADQISALMRHELLSLREEMLLGQLESIRRENPPSQPGHGGESQ